MKIRIFSSQKHFNLTEEINEFLVSKPKIAQVLQSQGNDGTITITIFYQETQPAKPAPPPADELPIER